MYPIENIQKIAKKNFFKIFKNKFFNSKKKCQTLNLTGHFDLKKYEKSVKQ